MNTPALAKFAPLIIRLILGLSFILHGLPKLTHSAMMVPFFTKIGVPAPSVAVLVIGLIEVIGGISLILGWGTRLFTVLLSIDMLMAILLTKLSAGYVGGFELELLLFAGSVSIFLSGPGAIAVNKGVVEQ